ncbi:cytochrome P450, partial [Striga asiatica]
MNENREERLCMDWAQSPNNNNGARIDEDCDKQTPNLPEKFQGIKQDNQIGGDEWKQSKMKLNPAFHLEKLKQMVPAMQCCTENIVNQWKNKIGDDGTCVVDVLPYLEDYSGTMVSQSLFHATFNDEMRRNFHYLRDLTIMTDTASKPLNFPGSERAKEMEKDVRRSFTQMIEQRLRDRRSSSGGPNEGSDLLDFILGELYELERSNSRVSNSKRKKLIEEAIAQTKLFYFAGFDTASNLLVWTMITLAIHQNWQDRAREEVLREEETQLGSLRIPKGVLLQLPIAMLHRDPQGSLKAANGQAAFMAFSWGPRTCIGKNFALVEGKAFVAHLLRTFSFQLGPTYLHAPYAAFTIQPQFGAPLLFVVMFILISLRLGPKITPQSIATTQHIHHITIQLIKPPSGRKTEKKGLALTIGSAYLKAPNKIKFSKIGLTAHLLEGNESGLKNPISWSSTT